MEKIKLFCFPYAGSSSRFYNQWNSMLGEFIEVMPIELPGHGFRKNEDLLYSFEEIANDLFSIIKNDLNCKYAFFGHSMGSLMAYKLFEMIKSHGLNLPIHMFFSACRPPHQVINDSKKMNDITDKEFAEIIYSLGGISDDIYNHERLLKKIISVIKADYISIENFSIKYDKPLNLGVNITVLAADDDIESNLENLIEWQLYTDKSFSVHRFNGGHFYILDQMNEISKYVVFYLSQYF